MIKSKPAYRSSATAVITPAHEYITKQIAAEQLGLSIRRVLELSNTGAIRRRQIIDPVTKRKQTVLYAKDVALVVAEGQKRPVYRGSAGEMAALPPVQPPPPVPDRPWLTIEEAADYSGLPASFLLGMVEEGSLPALDVGVRAGGRYRVSRLDVDAIKATAARR